MAKYSTGPVTFHSLIPKKMNIHGMIAPYRDAAIKTAKDMGKDLEKVTKTWKGDKPRIQTEAKLVPAGEPGYPKFHTSFASSAWPKDDGSDGYNKFKWLDAGTKVRYATMTKGFIPKTRGGQLNSWKGRGGMMFVNKKRPRPGIKARKFMVALKKKWKQPFKDRMVTANKQAAKASGHSVR